MLRAMLAGGAGKQGKSRRACKPGSVENDHSSRPGIAAGLKRPTREFGAPGRCAHPCLRHLSAWHGKGSSRLFGLAPCGVYHAACIAAGAVRSYRTFSPLPRLPAQNGAVSSLWHWPSLRLDAQIPGVTRHTAPRSPDFPPPHAMMCVQRRSFSPPAWLKYT